MSRFVRRRWISDLAEPSVPIRRSFEYEAYIPDMLVERDFALDDDATAEVAAAEAAIARLNADAANLINTDLANTRLINTEPFDRMLLRAEAISSSRIKGLDVPPRHVLHAEIVRDLATRPREVIAAVVGNIDALMHGVERLRAGDQISVNLLLELHRRLLTGTRLQEYGGRFRTIQNWVGGRSDNPGSAVFIPPSPEYVADLVTDLISFANDDRLPAVAQAAIVQAHFETIRPFMHGNGRLGRVLSQLVLRHRGLAPRLLPPVSVVLATRKRAYYTALAGFRYRGSAGGEEARAGVSRWVSRYSAVCVHAVAEADWLVTRARRVQDAWRERAGLLRAHSAVSRLISALIGAPVVNAGSAAFLIGRKYYAANSAISALVNAGVLHQINDGNHNRVYEAPDIISIYAALRRQLGNSYAGTMAWGAPYVGRNRS